MRDREAENRNAQAMEIGSYLQAKKASSSSRLVGAGNGAPGFSSVGKLT